MVDKVIDYIKFFGYDFLEDEKIKLQIVIDGLIDYLKLKCNLDTLPERPVIYNFLACGYILNKNNIDLIEATENIDGVSIKSITEGNVKTEFTIAKTNKDVYVENITLKYQKYYYDIITSLRGLTW